MRAYLYVYSPIYFQIVVFFVWYQTSLTIPFFCRFNLFSENTHPNKQKQRFLDCMNYPNFYQHWLFFIFLIGAPDFWLRVAIKHQEQSPQPQSLLSVRDIIILFLFPSLFHSNIIEKLISANIKGLSLFILSLCNDEADLWNDRHEAMRQKCH